MTPLYWKEPASKPNPAGSGLFIRVIRSILVLPLYDKGDSLVGCRTYTLSNKAIDSKAFLTHLLMKGRLHRIPEK